MTTQIFGDYIEEMNDMKYLKLGFSPSDFSLQHRWRTNGLSANFIADYLPLFFVGSPKNNKNVDAPIPARSKNAVKCIANELLENAMKFSDEESSHPTRISFHLYDNKLIFHVINSLKPNTVEKFQDFLKQLINCDPHDLYFHRMEDNAENDNRQSGLGILSMVCDYGAKLGWKFETVQDNPPLVVVTTMVCLNI